jgi:hypothetical protein
MSSAAANRRATISAVSSSLTVRPARVEDVAQMARVNVRSWQETYRGLMSDAVLDDPGFLAARERFWTPALTDERYRENRVAVAERDGDWSGSPCRARPWTPRRRGRGSCMCSMCMQPTAARALGGRCWRGSSIPVSRRPCGWPTRTLAHRRSTASTASLPMGRPRSRTGCGRSAWSAACSTVGSRARRFFRCRSPRAGRPTAGLPTALATAPDPRARRGIRHRLTVVVTAAICAVVAGYRS